MKATKWMTLVLLGVTLSVTPTFAQRGHSSGSSRGGFSGGNRSSSSMGSSRGGGFSGASSRSTSSMGSSRSMSSPSRSTTTYSPSSSRSISTTRATHSSASTPSRQMSTGTSSVGRSTSTPSRESFSRTKSDSRVATPRSQSSAEMGSPRGSSKMGAPKDARSLVTSRPVPTTKRPGYAERTPSPQYASPAQPRGPMPPSHIHPHVHPAPFFHHPIHHGFIHMHPIYWDPFLPPVIHWGGFWGFCWGYWAGSYCTDVVVVREYVKETQKANLIDFVMTDDLMYALIEDADGETYLRVFDKDDNILAQHPVGRKYVKTTLDPDNGGCWIMKKKDKDPLLFIYSNNELLIYEAD